MKNSFKTILFIILVLMISCNQKQETAEKYNENRELVPNPEGLQKDTFPANDIDCKCADNDLAGTKTDTVYELSNGKKIALCGYRNTENNPVNFSEFVLSVCGENKIIDFWGATETCNLKTLKDTLFVEQLLDLPLGENRKNINTVWGIDKIYFKNGKLIRKHSINQNIRKYNSEEISKTLKEYENANKILNEDKMILVNRLFIASISNDKKAEEYFYQFGSKYKPDGAFSEEYSDLKAMFELWKK